MLLLLLLLLLLLFLLLPITQCCSQGLVIDFISGVSVCCHKLCCSLLPSSAQTGPVYVYAVAATVVVMSAGDV